MLTKILIANRGEIACRIIRTARRLGIATVAVYSDADARALHVAHADEAVHIGPSPAPDSYLRCDKIIAAAKATGAQAIHPGYGFLSENAEFADAVVKAGLVFIGPTAEAMRALGGKAAAKEIAIRAGVPVVPGYQGDKQDAKSLAAEARKVGYPVMIKAVAGGGGRGMRLVETEADLPELLASAQREAEGAFGDARVLIEKVVVKPRHIEVQVFGDRHGNVVHLFERDCTLQRRNQKVVEEAPAPGMSAALREKMCAAAVKLAKSVGYEGAGTVEFLVEGGKLDSDAPWYFIEMNTRLQVEHPVTEEITGLDLVEWQLRVAAGETLPLPQDKIKMAGHAIEVRLCAEDPAKGFLPSIGRIDAFAMPLAEDVEGLRVEAGVTAGGSISPFYDSMIAKLITHGPRRGDAVSRLVKALELSLICGPRTNAAFLKALLEHPDVGAGRMDTGLIGRDIAALTSQRIDVAAIEEGVRCLIEDRVRQSAERRTGQGDVHAQFPAGTGFHDARTSVWDATDAFQIGEARALRYTIAVDGENRTFRAGWPRAGALPAIVPEFDSNGCGVTSQTLGPAYIEGVSTADGGVTPGTGAMAIRQVVAGDRRYVVSNLLQACLEWPTYDPSSVDDGGDGSAIRAPINGKVAKVFGAEGEAVEKGARVAVVEAMKMEHVLHAAKAGVVGKIAAREGQQVTQGTVIILFAE